MNSPDVLIVGGGLWGLTTAWHLATAHGVSVRVIERRAAPGEETSSRAAGQIGQVRERAVARDAARYALEFASALSRRRDGLAFVRSGSVTVVRDCGAAGLLRSRFAEASAHGVSVDVVSGDDARALVPGLTGDIAAAFHVPSDGYVEIPRFVTALAAETRALGVEVICDVVVTGLDAAADRVQAVRTSRGRLSAGLVLVAAGPWTGSLLPPTGWRAPFVPVVLRQARSAAIGVPREHPVVRFPEAGAYVRPEDGGYLFGAFSTAPELVAPPGLPPSVRTEDLAPKPALIEPTRERLATWLPALADRPVAHYRQGWTTFSPDGLPLAGRHPSISNLWIATACGAMGFVWAPALGRWIAQAMVEPQPVAALAALDPDRFGTRAADTDWVRDQCRHRHADYYGLAGRTAGTTAGPSAEHYAWK